jgi:hypothetical protein
MDLAALAVLEERGAPEAFEGAVSEGRERRAYAVLVCFINQC